VWQAGDRGILDGRFLWQKLFFALKINGLHTT
jgi:hypothetical protein